MTITYHKPTDIWVNPTLHIRPKSDGYLIVDPLQWNQEYMYPIAVERDGSTLKVTVLRNVGGW